MSHARIEDVAVSSKRSWQETKQIWKIPSLEYLLQQEMQKKKNSASPSGEKKEKNKREQEVLHLLLFYFTFNTKILAVFFQVSEVQLSLKYI